MPPSHPNFMFDKIVFIVFIKTVHWPLKLIWEWDPEKLFSVPSRRERVFTFQQEVPYCSYYLVAWPCLIQM